MFILEGPYVSGLLADTVAASGLPVLDTSMARRSLAGRDVMWLDDAAFSAAYRAAEAPRLYTNSENAIGWVMEHLAGTGLSRMVNVCKDKVAFRHFIADMHPGYGYREFRLGQADDFDPTSLRVPFVVKPAVGFFSLGVHVVARVEQWPAIAATLKSEARRHAATYPQHVLDFDRFIAEEVIPGDEYAVDAFYDADGRLTVVNVYGHLFASADDVSDRVYHTSVALVQRMAGPLGAYLQAFGRRAGLANFPVHAELRVAADGAIGAIEVNPLRFGGWCATDLAHFAYGVNPYRCYLDGEHPDWDELAVSRAGVVTALVVADVPAHVDLASIESVDYQAFAARFSRLLELRPVEYHRYPVFAFTFVQVPEDDQGELFAVVGADLTQYLRMRG